MACGSTRRSRSTTRRRRHIVTEVAAAVRAAARGDANDHRRRKRAAEARWYGRGRAAEMRRRVWNDDFHHSVRVAATGRDEAYYSGYRGSAAGVHLGRQIWIPVSGPIVSVAGTAARDAGVRPAAARFVSSPTTTIRSRTRRRTRLHQETSPAVSRADRAAAAPPADADALSGAGVPASRAVFLFRRSQRRSGKLVRAGPPSSSPSSQASRRRTEPRARPIPATPNFPAVQAGLVRARAERRGAGASQGLAASSPRGSRVARAAHARGRWRRIVRSRLRAALFRRVQGIGSSSSISVAPARSRHAGAAARAAARRVVAKRVLDGIAEIRRVGNAAARNDRDGWWIPGECAVLLAQMMPRRLLDKVTSPARPAGRPRRANAGAARHASGS